MKPALILASASPRRAELLTMLGLCFEVQPVDLDEAALTDGLPAEEVVSELALAKAAAVVPEVGTATVVGADTVVAVGTAVLGKPATSIEARDFLEAMSGRQVSVLTGIAVIERDLVHHEVVETALTMRRLSTLAVERYVASGAAFGKAGGLEVQGRARSFVLDVAGCWTNVVGLPLCATARLLGVDCPDGVCAVP